MTAELYLLSSCDNECIMMRLSHDNVFSMNPCIGNLLSTFYQNELLCCLIDDGGDMASLSSVIVTK